MIRLTRDEEDVKVTFEMDNDIALTNLVAAMREFCLAMGYHHSIVEGCFGDEHE